MGAPKVIYRDKREDNSWLRYIYARIFRRNENAMIGVTGPTGSGKTYSAISIAEMLRDDYGFTFNIDHVVFSFLSLMRLINEGDLPRGAVIVFDEPQTEINSKSHQSEVNKVFSQLVSTFRHRGFVLLFANPFLEDLDKSTRKLFHANFQVQSKNAKDMTCKIKPVYLEWSSSKDNWYRHFLKVVWKPEGKSKCVSSKLKSWSIPHPSKEITEQYEIKKREFTDALNKRIQQKLEKLDADNNTPELSPLDKLTEKQLEVLEVCSNHPNQYNAAEELGITSAGVSSHLKACAKKGISLRNYPKYRDMEENK